MPKALSEVMQNMLKTLEERRQHNVQIAGTCPKHGEYTNGDAIQTGGVCPECFAAEQENIERVADLHRQLEISGIPLRFRGCSFQTFAPPSQKAATVFEAMRQYADNFPAHLACGRSIIIAGNTGTGKTHLACAAMQHIMLEHRMRCLYAAAYHIVREIKETYGRHAARTEKSVVREFVGPHLLVVDEVGSQYGTEAEKLLLFEVLNGRYEDMKPTIVVSNLNTSGISEYLGHRVVDRLRENSGAMLVFDWKSNRGTKGKSA